MKRALAALVVCGACLIALAADEAPEGWPFDTAEAQRRQQDCAAGLGTEVTRTLTLPGGGTLTLVLIPSGRFLIGAPDGESLLDPDEGPRFVAEVPGPFWMSRCEITNAQYRLFRPDHSSGNIDTYWKDRVGPGPSLDGDDQPVVRVSWHEAKAFCEWLGQQLGKTVRLPTEPEWEWACRAGTDSRFHCDPAELDKYANLADASLRSIKPWALRDNERNDGVAVSASVGRYLPNAWGLCDMHGNVAEWCESVYQPYPLNVTSESDATADPEAPRVIRGGSWDDRPRRTRSAFRLSYPPSQRVYNVGFRVVVEE